MERPTRAVRISSGMAALSVAALMIYLAADPSYGSCQTPECVQASCKWAGADDRCIEYDLTNAECMKHNTSSGTGFRKYNPEQTFKTRRAMCNTNYCANPDTLSSYYLGNACSSTDNFGPGDKRYYCSNDSNESDYSTCP